eukprot:COSAG06_NODE_10952_length_1591_cov_4.561662_1_plen_74_part_00
MMEGETHTRPVIEAGGSTGGLPGLRWALIQILAARHRMIGMIWTAGPLIFIDSRMIWTAGPLIFIDSRTLDIY